MIKPPIADTIGGFEVVSYQFLDAFGNHTREDMAFQGDELAVTCKLPDIDSGRRIPVVAVAHATVFDIMIVKMCLKLFACKKTGHRYSSFFYMISYITVL